MGTAISVDVRDAVRPLAVTSVFEWFRWVDETFSTYKADSQISRLGRGQLTLDECDDRVRWVLDRCEAVRQATGGFFDARATGTLDPSGLVKGWSVEVASEMLVEAGSNSHCINAGGDIRMRGEPGPGRPWRVGISHPLVAGHLTVIVIGHDLAVATSGTAERGLHITNPFTRSPAAALASVTVVGPDLTLADCYATAAMAMGLDAPAWLARLADHEAYLIDASGHAWWTVDFPRHAPALATLPQPRLASDGI